MIEKSDKLREMLDQYKLYESQLASILEQVQNIEKTLADFDLAGETLENLKRADKDSEILVPIGADSFVSARLSDTENVLVGIGSGVIVKKPVEDSKKLIEKTAKNLQKNLEQFSILAKKVQEKMSELAPKIQESGKSYLS